MSDKIEPGMLCGVLQSNFSRLSQSESRTQPCHVRMPYTNHDHSWIISTIWERFRFPLRYTSLISVCDINMTWPRN